MRLKYWMCELIACLVCIFTSLLIGFSIVFFIGEKAREIGMGFFIVLGMLITIALFYPVREYLYYKYGE